jgi:hypothetical protein
VTGNIPFENVFLFGNGIWEIKDFFIVWDFKIQISSVDRGKAYNYICNVSVHDDLNTYYCILCDIKNFYIICGHYGRLTSVNKCLWTDGGSRDVLLNVLSYRNKSLKLLEHMCSHNNNNNNKNLLLKPVEFLGAGKYGRCFKVKNLDTNQHLVLKTVLTVDDRDNEIKSLVTHEFEKLMKLQHLDHVVKIVPHSLQILCVESEEEDKNSGIGYLMHSVGEPLSAEKCLQGPLSYDYKSPFENCLLYKLIMSLNSLHLQGFYHGDARVQNAILMETDKNVVD